MVLTYVHNNFYPLFVEAAKDYNLNRYDFDVTFLVAAIMLIVLCGCVGKHLGSRFFEGCLKLYPLFYLSHCYFMTQFSVVTPPELNILSFFYMVDSTIYIFYNYFLMISFPFMFYYMFKLHDNLMKELDAYDKRKADKRKRKEGGV